jgi:hypothetical protein
MSSGKIHKNWLGVSKCTKGGIDVQIHMTIRKKV